MVNIYASTPEACALFRIGNDELTCRKLDCALRPAPAAYAPFIQGLYSWPDNHDRDRDVVGSHCRFHRWPVLTAAAGIPLRRLFPVAGLPRFWQGVYMTLTPVKLKRMTVVTAGS